MKKYLVLFCIIQSVALYGQSTFSVLYGTNNDLEQALTVRDNMDALVVVIADNNVFFDDDEMSMARMTMLKMDYEGNILSVKSYYNHMDSIAFFAPVSRLSKTTDGGFVSGITLRRVAQNDSSNYYGYGLHAMIMKFDHDLDTLWTYTLGEDWYDIETQYLAASATELNGFYYLSGTRLKDEQITAMTCKFDSDGELIWEHYDQFLFSDARGGWIEATDNNSLVSIRVRNSVNSEYVIEMNEDGEMLQYHTFDWNQNWGSYPGLKVVDGSSVVSVNRIGPSTFNAERINIADGFSELWTDTFSLDVTNSADYYFGIDEGLNGDIITAGTTFTNDLGQHGFMRKYSLEGEVVWTRRYKHVDYLYAVQILRSVTATSDGGYAASGNVAASAIGIIQDGWIIKVDSMGCLVPGCDTLVGIGEMESELQNEWFSFGPNPIKKGQSLNVFYVGNNTQGLKATAIHRFVLTNTNGQIVNEFETDDLSTTYLVNTQNLSAGLYVFSFFEGSRVLQSEKVVIVE